ncbi:hypothetical protein EMCG_07567 [[Emmonsia] crescens]|uniref:GRF-type domain-containing protein n=1 Tax=[Emmonsia] crescens TaxID=73230 RepID=A0A0G2JB24_9EURO|nr:hypothetical protein EMCG_07567 [Emmonsia crescens UAMH 3008]
MFTRHNPSPSTPSARDRNNQPASASPGFSTPSRSTAVPLRGLLVNGVWHCNCEPRRQADHFQTKNGGRNHGRWFYTCPKPQGNRCNFFLWEDEAEIRESDMVKVLKGAETGTEAEAGAAGDAASNANTGSMPSIRRGFMNRTPSRPLVQASIDARTGLLTPKSGTKRNRDDEGGYGYGYGMNSVSGMGSPSKKSRMEDVFVQREDEEEADDDSFGWDEDLEGSVVEQLDIQVDSQQKQKQKQQKGRGQGIFQPSTPRRSPGWFRDGQGLFMSEDEDEAAHGDGEDGSQHGQRDKDPTGLDDPSSRSFAQDQPPNDSPSTPLSRLSASQTTRSTSTYEHNTATTPSRTTIADPFDLAAPSTPTPTRFNSTLLFHRDSQQEPPATAPPIISSTTTSISSPQKTGTIVSQTLALLSKHDIRMPPAAKRELVTLLNMEYLRTQGIIKGRDISRAAVQSRDAQIQRLRGRIEVLEAEREGFRLKRLSRDSARFHMLGGMEERDEG